MELDKTVLGNKRKDYLNWDEFFMGIAKLAAGRSKDPNTQVGACIVSEDNRILSIGYNGAPNNFSDDIITTTILGHPVAAVHGDKDKQATIVANLSMITRNIYDLVCAAHLHHFSADE